MSLCHPKLTFATGAITSGSCPDPLCSGIDNPQSRAHICKWVDTTCLRPPGYGERIKSLSGFLCRANESVTQASDRSPVQRRVSCAISADAKAMAQALRDELKAKGVILRLMNSWDEVFAGGGSASGDFLSD
jgi:hypothetical protein